MAYENMTADSIEQELDELGETGSAKIKNRNELHVQREENTDWLFVGTVADPEEAKTALEEYFNQ